MKIIKSLLLVLLILAVGLIGGYLFEINRAVDSSDTTYQSFTIKDGEGTDQVLDNLADNGLIRNKLSTKIYMRLHNVGLFANEYVLQKSMDTKEVLSVLSNPTTNIDDTNGLVLTIIEGDNIEAIAGNIAHGTDYTKEEVLNLWNDKAFLQKLIDKYWFITDDILNKEIKQPLEGYFTPATYKFVKTKSLEDITYDLLDKSAENFEQFKGQDFKKYSFHEVLTLASIIERETNTDEDKYKVSSVFHNRIEQDMPLQADITVLYAMGKHKNIVSYDDLEYDSPYNTYQNRGLPPGPISSPSITAIDAAINPDKTDYVYYYTIPDATETLYSKTYEEHLKIVDKYQ